MAHAQGPPFQGGALHPGRHTAFGLNMVEVQSDCSDFDTGHWQWMEAVVYQGVPAVDNLGRHGLPAPLREGNALVGQVVQAASGMRHTDLRTACHEVQRKKQQDKTNNRLRSLQKIRCDGHHTSVNMFTGQKDGAGEAPLGPLTYSTDLDGKDPL
jgi:hypothetical protein